MATIPVIVGLGGINAAGRSSGFHSYKRLVSEALNEEQMSDTWRDLANRMGLSSDESSPSEHLDQALIEAIKAGTLIRRIESFDPDARVIHQKMDVEASEQQLQFTVRKSKLPQTLPESWTITGEDGKKVQITVSGDFSMLLEDKVEFPVSSGGNLPSGFDPADLYNSRYHPRGLTMTVYGASDCLNSLGFDWQQVLDKIRPEQVSVYAGSGLAQIDDNSIAGMIASPLKGGRVSSKMMALSLAEMPADFINGYMIDSVGTTGTNMGACANISL